MGCFDSVIMSCPCGGEVEFQSKAGVCALVRYYPEKGDVPPESVLSDLLAPIPYDRERGHHEGSCNKCGKVYELVFGLKLVTKGD